MLQRRHVPEQRFREREEVVVLDVDCGDVGCTREVKRVEVQAVELAPLNVAGRVSHASVVVCRRSWRATPVVREGGQWRGGGKTRPGRSAAYSMMLPEH